MTDTPERPDYSPYAGSYAVSRPAYPEGLFEWLASIASRREVAWDVATGSGQAAVGLAPHFRRVIATDHSEQQIRHAAARPNVEYRVASAEVSGLPDASVDLIASAAAIHWFDLDTFYAEARRVTRPGGVLAAWTYHIGHVEPPFDAVFGPFYENVVKPYFAPGARLVDDHYEGIVLPGTPLQAPAFVMSARWTAADIVRFIRTWSGVQTCIERTGSDPVTRIAPAIEALCGAPDAMRELRWPLYLRVSRLGG